MLIYLGLLVGLLNSQVGSGPLFWNIPNFTVFFLQLVLNVMITAFCLFNFVYSVRMNIRTALLITSDPKKFERGVELAIDAFRSTQNHWMIGVRGLYYLAAAVTWFLNATIFMLFTIIVTIYLVITKDILILSPRSRKNGQ